MSIFICEKCGKLDDTALSNNYWHAHANQSLKSMGEEIRIFYKLEFEYFETHVCCSDCCDGIVSADCSEVIHSTESDIKEKTHWSQIGKEKLLELEKRRDGSMENATESLRSIGEI